MSTKCDICVKTVYPMDPQINLDGAIFHKTCAKCEECRCQITLSNFCRSGNTLLCKTHYFKRFSETGQYLGGEKFTQKSGTNTEGRVSPVPATSNLSPVPRSNSPQPMKSSATVSSGSEAKPAVELPEGATSLKDRMRAFSGTPATEDRQTSPSPAKKAAKVFGTARVVCPSCEKSVYPNDPQITIDGFTFHNTCAKCADCNCQITLANFTKTGTTLLCKTHYFKRFSEEGSYLGGEKFTQKSAKNATDVSDSSEVSSLSVAVENVKLDSVIEKAAPIVEKTAPVVEEIVESKVEEEEAKTIVDSVVEENTVTEVDNTSAVTTEEVTVEVVETANVVTETVGVTTTTADDNYTGTVDDSNAVTEEESV